MLTVKYEINSDKERHYTPLSQSRTARPNIWFLVYSSTFKLEKIIMAQWRVSLYLLIKKINNYKLKPFYNEFISK